MGYSQIVSIDSLTPCYAKIRPCSHEIYLACTKFCPEKAKFHWILFRIPRTNYPIKHSKQSWTKNPCWGSWCKIIQKTSRTGFYFEHHLNCCHFYESNTIMVFWWYIICDPSKSAWLLTPRLAMVKLPVCQLVNWLTDNDVVMPLKQRFDYFLRIQLKIKISVWHH